MLEQWLTDLNAALGTPDKQLQALEAVAVVGLAIAFGVAMHYTEIAYNKIRGNFIMRKRARLSQAVGEVLEDKFVCGLTEAICSNRITIEEARMVYAKVAHLGFWGLHPRKFAPKKTALDMQELKDQLRTKWKPGKQSEGVVQPTASAVVNKMLDGVDEAFA